MKSKYMFFIGLLSALFSFTSFSTEQLSSDTINLQGQIKPTSIIEVLPYDKQWPEIFEIEASKIREVLRENCVDIHHIGSTSVPNLSAKPIIDIIAVLRDTSEAIEKFGSIGYKYKGEFNIPFRLFFGKPANPLEVNLHVHEVGNPEIELNILFRNFLRSSAESCEEYGALKRELISQKSSHEKVSGGFTGYSLGKDTFIKKILDQTNFDGHCIRFCTHYAEWETYHKIRTSQMLQSADTVYNQGDPMFKMENNYHFVLYKGLKIVSIAHLELLKSTNTIALRFFATDEPYKRSGHGSKLVGLIEKWTKRQGVKTIKMHAETRSENFWRSLGYAEIILDDGLDSLMTIDLGKDL